MDITRSTRSTEGTVSAVSVSAVTAAGAVGAVEGVVVAGAAKSPQHVKHKPCCSEQDGKKFKEL